MKKTIITVFIFIVIVASVIQFWISKTDKPLLLLKAADISCASAKLLPPNKTTQITEFEELVGYLNEIIVYKKDPAYVKYAGQTVIFTITLNDGTKLEIQESDPYVIIDGIRYQTKYDICEKLNHYANQLLNDS